MINSPVGNRLAFKPQGVWPHALHLPQSIDDQWLLTIEMDCKCLPSQSNSEIQLELEDVRFYKVDVNMR